MHKFTQEEYNALPVVNDIKQCPTGDYSLTCRFAAGCSFAEGCILENNQTMLGPVTFSAFGFGSRSASIYGIPTQKHVYIRCGCWAGTLAEFRERVRVVHKESVYAKEYAIIADLFEAKWKRILESKGA